MKPLPVACLLLTAGLAVAQDMPLHEILKPGEAWQAHSGGMPTPKPAGYAVDPKARTISREGGEPTKLPDREPTACLVALNGSVLLVADAADRYVWAYRIEKDGSLGPGDRYCRLRVRGDDRRKKLTPPEAYRADPSAMTGDAANRTYVATSLGIQVFDPTGRLCGVFTAPPGRVADLAFDGDRLFARTGDQVYVRRMMTR